MRDKFLDGGERAFATYELLEMFLYSTSRYKDTNPLSKLLLKTFGGVEGVLEASREELLRVDGVGERTVDALLSLLPFLRFIKEKAADDEFNVDAGDYSDMGKRFVEYFKGETDYAVAVMLIDNKNRVIGIETLCKLDFHSAGVRSQAFVDSALRSGASSIAIAHLHPHGPAFPSPGDIETNRMIAGCLERMGIGVLEHYVVSGRDYIGFMNRLTALKMCALDGLDELGSAEACQIKSAKHLCDIIGSFCSVDPLVMSRALLEKRSLENLLSLDTELLGNVIEAEGQGAFYLKIALALVMRACTDSFKVGRVYDSVSVAEYFKAKFYTSRLEEIHIMSFDKDNRLICCDFLVDGTVNVSSIVPRRAMEAAIKRGASGVILAHNHPGGSATPSNEDMTSTRSLYEFFSSTDVRFLGHFVIAGKDAALIDCDNDCINFFNKTH